MKKQNKGLIALAFVVCCLGGCKGTDFVDISQDGRSAVLVNDNKLTFRDLTRKTPDETLKIDVPTDTSASNTIVIGSPELSSPRFSPDGKYVAVLAGIETVLLDTAHHRQSVIPNFDRPLVWRPDSSELLGFQGQNAKVFHVRSQSIVRSYSLPGLASCATWIGSGRDIAVGVNHEIELLRNGIAKAVELDGRAHTIAFDNSRHRIVWIEQDDKTKDDLKRKFTVNDIGENLEGKETLLAPTTAKKLLASTTDTLLLSDAVSPDGASVNFFGIVDDSPPGVAAKYMDQRSSKDLSDKQVAALERQVRAHFVSVRVPIRGTPAQAVVLYRSKQMNVAKLQTTRAQGLWTPDGKALVVAIDDKLQFVPLN